MTAYTYQRAIDFTIVATMAFAPDNTAPEDAVELTPGVAYGPLTGYDGLDQYFKIQVPTGTERLEVDLSEGYGEATMFMRLEQFPTSGEFDLQSSTPGAGDKIGFNDPTPGTWYILLTTEDVFANILITASFEDRYIWTYDGTPIELFNGEEINGLEAPAGESLLFFVELENPGSYLEINTYGGTGSLELEGSGMVFEFDFGGFFPEEGEDGKTEDGKTEGRQGRPVDGFTAAEVQVDSFGEGTEHTLFINMPANGRFDITLTVFDEISDVSIIAVWEDSQAPPIDPIDPDGGGAIEVTCEDEARDIFETTDADRNGVIDEREFEFQSGEGSMFDSIDMNSDGEIEFREALQEICSCENEILILASQLSPFSDGITLKEFSQLDLKNTYDTKVIDTNKDGFIDAEEMEILSIVCETSFDAFDGDGDGVPDKDDAFPEDPDESKDTDGDGVGDNADIAPSVANDLIYGSIGLVGFVVLSLLVLFGVGALRGPQGSSSTNEWEEMKQQDIASQMLGMEETDPITAQPSSSVDNLYVQNMPSEGAEVFVQQSTLVTSVPSMEAFTDLLESNEAPSTAPPQQLMGMLDASGAEVLEYPAGSGTMWTRGSPTEGWHQR